MYGCATRGGRSRANETRRRERALMHGDMDANDLGDETYQLPAGPPRRDRVDPRVRAGYPQAHPKIDHKRFSLQYDDILGRQVLVAYPHEPERFKPLRGFALFEFDRDECCMLQLCKK